MSRFPAFWAALDEETRQAIRAKARWERMTLRAVIREWWPALYAVLSD